MQIANYDPRQPEDDRAIDDLLAEFRVARALRQTLTWLRQVVIDNWNIAVF